MKELLKYREEIAPKLQEHIQTLFDDFKDISPLGDQLRDRLSDYALRGKLIRGSLVLFAYDLLDGSGIHREDLLTVSAAIELFQSMLLIHDDIMDQDDMRRGKPSIHRQYAMDGEKLNFADAGHFGESMAICGGDVSSFLAFSLLSSIQVDHAIKLELMKFVSREMIVVGLAQMQDVYNSELDGADVALSDVENMYRYKTGRYTFSLPMSLGALLAGKDGSFRGVIEAIGEILGVIFQIVDDKIGLFADESKTGKPKASDLYEGKKTVYMQTLLESCTADEKNRLASLLGNIQGEADVKWIFDCLKRHSVVDTVEKRLKGLAADCKDQIEKLKTSHENLAVGLKTLLDFNLTRDY